MLSFKQHLVEQEQLNEKLLLINNGKKYGQIVFLAGGAASGKGFAGTNFMNIQDFKVRDVDEMKKLYLKMNKLKHKYPELDGINLKKPADVARLHQFVKDKKFEKDTMDYLIQAMGNPETLPNIVFDVTLKDLGKIKKNLPALLDSGYKSENVHIIWILTDYEIAVVANKDRDRVVPYGQDGSPNIMLQTHKGAADTMWSIVGKGNIPKNVNGGIYVILNNRENTVFFKQDDSKDYRSSKDNKDGEVRKTTGKKKYLAKDNDERGTSTKIIKDFTYLTYKEPGKSPKKDKEIYNQLFRWVTTNVPKGSI